MKQLLSLILLFASAVSASAITIDTVPVGDAGNVNDPATGNSYGGVAYAYNIGKYEVTVGQYTAFLNAVAATDTYALYDIQMTHATVAGIQRSGVSGNYTYTPIGSPNHPISSVGWGDAARFANWLHNGQPSGAQNASTTEDGAYTMNGAVSTSALLGVLRNPNARWFIPTENEWYKAAYYQPASSGGDIDDYWNYPMRTNNMPYSDAPPGTTPDNSRVANFRFDDGIANGYNGGFAVTGSNSFNSSQNYLTNVGAYSFSPSHYGTFDQGGNVYEWTETASFVPGNSSLERVQRGTSYSGGAFAMEATFRGASFLIGGSIFGGFRVAAAVPEPSTMVLIGFAAVSSLRCRRRESY